MSMDIPEEKKEALKEAAKYSRKALLEAARFSNRKDALGAVIKENECLSIDEAEARLEDFLKQEVN